jgi:hypothetical protein
VNSFPLLGANGIAPEQELSTPATQRPSAEPGCTGPPPDGRFRSRTIRPLDCVLAVLRDSRTKGMTGGDVRALALAVTKFAHADGWFFASEAAWAELALTKPRSLRRSLSRLKAAGVLEIWPQFAAGGRREANLYRLTAHPREPTGTGRSSTPGAPSSAGRWSTGGLRDPADEGPDLQGGMHRGAVTGDGDRGLNDTGPTPAPDDAKMSPTDHGPSLDCPSTPLGNGEVESPLVAGRGLSRASFELLEETLGPILDDADPPTREQASLLLEAARDYPDKLAAHAWDTYRSAGTRSPLALLLWRVKHWDEVIEGWWVEGDWERAHRPSPGQACGDEEAADGLGVSDGDLARWEAMARGVS